jgi:hypothetical protein
MMGRFFKAMAAALAALGNFTKWSWDVLWATARMPFELISTRPPLPHYEPQVTQSDVVQDFVHARQAQKGVRTLDRDAVDQLLDYCRAHRDDRVTMRLPKDLPAPVVASLLSMDDGELRKLATSGIGQLRKFMHGQPHGIHGVPSAEPAVPVAANDTPPVGMTQDQKRLWKVRASYLKDRAEPFKPIKPRPLAM